MGNMITKHRRVLGLMVGAAAVAVMATLTVTHPDMSSGGGIPLAGSGDAPANTTYVHPAVGQMNVGGTVTATVPQSAAK